MSLKLFSSHFEKNIFYRIRNIEKLGKLNIWNKLVLATELMIKIDHR